MLSFGRLIEYEAVLEETISQIEFFKISIENKYNQIENIKLFIKNICVRNCLTTDAENGIYTKNLISRDLRAENENILKLFLDCCEKPRDEVQKHCKKFENNKNIHLESVVQSFSTNEDFNCLLKRKFIFKNPCNSVNEDNFLSETDIKESAHTFKPLNVFRLFKEKFVFDVSMASLLLLEEEFLYKASEFLTISNHEKLYFDTTYVIFLLIDFKNELSSCASYQIFFNNLNLLRMQSNFLKQLLDSMNKYPLLEEDLKRKINQELLTKVDSTRNLDQMIKVKNYEKAKAKVANIKKRDYYEHWKNSKMERIKKMQNIDIFKLFSDKKNISNNKEIENIVHSLMIRAYKNTNEKLKQTEKVWEMRLDKAIDDINAKVDDRKKEANEIHSKLLKLSRKFESYNEIVMNYKKDKIENAEREINITKVSNAAKVITNWWIDKEDIGIKKKIRKKRKQKNKINKSTKKLRNHIL